MSRLAIITARGGSKRIPKKNIREFCGKPILAYSIEAALASGLFDHVMVSTDDEEIAQIAEKYGAAFLEASSVAATAADAIHIDNSSPETLLPPMTCWQRCWQSMRSGGCILTLPAVSILRPLL